MLRAFITGCAGPELTADEAAFIREARPCGLILFARNCRGRDQVRALTDGFRDAVGTADVLVLVDQEGGRVQRMGPPVWERLPAAARFGELYGDDPEKACAGARLLAHWCALGLARHGINMNCAPVLDLPVAGAHEVIGDRAYGRTPEQVSALGRAVAEGHLAGGILPVIKHVPGHGRATSDSHRELPVVTASRPVLSASDFAPFGNLRDMPAAMTAHVVYDALDPGNAASVSPTVIADVVRGEIGFDGLLMSDDLAMQALEGTPGARTRAVLAAGCDVALHCNGVLAEMSAVADAAPSLAGRPLQRLDAALRRAASPEPCDADAARALAHALVSVQTRCESV